MKRRIYFLVLAMLVSVMSFAQHPSVQGVPRSQVKNSVKSEPAVVYPNIDFDMIEYWVGEGDNMAALVVKWDDGKGGNKNLVWGYRWHDAANGTGEAMLRAVAKEDPRFYILVYNDKSGGITIGGMGYDLNGNGRTGLFKKGQYCELSDGLYYTSSYDFDEYTASDSYDHWQSGWTKGFWCCYFAEDLENSFDFHGIANPSLSSLKDGNIFGMAFASDLSEWNNLSMSGDVEYVSEPNSSHRNALNMQQSETPQVDYTKGTFVVNEDWYGHQNSTVNFLTDDGEWYYRVVQAENPGVELGCTNQYGTIYGDKFYLIAKQEKDPGATITGGRITVCDAKTMKVLTQIQNIAVDEKGKSIADGRGFLGVDEHKGYVGTSNGIYIFDLDNLEITGIVNGSGGSSTSLYSDQIGNMVRVNDRVFAVHQKAGLFVINPETDEIEETIEAPEGWGFGSVVMSKDGNLWLSLANKSGNGGADNRIVKLNPATLEQEIIELPDGINGPANSWYAWTPDCFCASTQNNVLYWNGGNSSWFSGQKIFKYDIDKGEFKKIIDLTDEGNYIYGCSFRIDPVTDEAYTSVQLGNQYGNKCELRRYDNEGNLLKSYQMITNYWFPSLPVFPDNEAPVVTDVDGVDMTTEKGTTVSLKDVASDADNMTAAIVKTIKEISDETVLTAEMKDGDLVITPLKAGKADITVQINSNGKLAETVVSVTVSEASGISGVEAEGAEESSRYTLDGKLLDAPQRGINIIRMSDGTIKKVVVK